MRLCFRLRHLIGDHCGLIIVVRFALDDADGVGGTSRKAIAQAIAVVVAKQTGLSVHHANGALVACAHAQAAPGALLFIDMDDVANHGGLLSLAVCAALSRRGQHSAS